MTKEQRTDPGQLLSAAEAERHLQGALGEPDGYWRLFLQNNRRPERNPPQVIPFQVHRGRPKYWVADLDEFISMHRAEVMKRGRVPGRVEEVMKALGGWPTGRPFVGWITPQVEEGTGVTFVRIQLADPLVIYRLDPDQAREVAADLLDAVAALDRASGRQP